MCSINQLTIASPQWSAGDVCEVGVRLRVAHYAVHAAVAAGAAAHRPVRCHAAGALARTRLVEYSGQAAAVLAFPAATPGQLAGIDVSADCAAGDV